MRKNRYFCIRFSSPLKYSEIQNQVYMSTSFKLGLKLNIDLNLLISVLDSSGCQVNLLFCYDCMELGPGLNYNTGLAQEAAPASAKNQGQQRLLTVSYNCILFNFILNALSFFNCGFLRDIRRAHHATGPFARMKQTTFLLTEIHNTASHYMFA